MMVLILDQHKSVGALMLLFPVRVAYQAFEPGSMESHWLEEVMERIVDLSGFEIGRELKRREDMQAEG
jgi:hypothetical protein